jgi:uncharacterized protein
MHKLDNMRVALVLFSAAIMPIVIPAQDLPTHPQRQLVRASGTAVLNVKPDQATISIGVTTQASTAQDAVAQNATRTTAVLNQLRTLLNGKGELKTANYSVSPQYRYPKEGGTPTIMGYGANNTVEIVLSDLSLVGKVIDQATQSGANTINNIGFSLRDDDAGLAQAIAQATRKAQANAEAIAAALGLRVVGVAEAETVDSSAPIRPMHAMAAMAKAGPPTPVETGDLDVSARVVVTLEVSK